MEIRHTTLMGEVFKLFYIKGGIKNGAEELFYNIVFYGLHDCFCGDAFCPAGD